ERSLPKDDQLEEERRLTLVGMTRAMQELYLTNARMREFRGMTNYAIPSMFLDELPEDVERVDLSGGMRASVIDSWRGGGAAAEVGWREAGVDRKRKKGDFAEGMVVKHDVYGVGQIVEVGGHGALRKVRIRFNEGGERTFLINNVRLEIISDEPVETSA